jgi:LysM repeat protein/uncharacterized protein (DUF2235 family)
MSGFDLDKTVDTAISAGEGADKVKYQASFAQIDNSGLSFGKYQNDVRTNPDASNAFEDVLTESGLSKKEVTTIMKKAQTRGVKASDFSADELKKINDALSSEQGKKIVNARDQAQKTKVVDAVKKVMETQKGTGGALDPANPDVASVNLVTAWANRTGGLNQMAAKATGKTWNHEDLNKYLTSMKQFRADGNAEDYGKWYKRVTGKTYNPPGSPGNKPGIYEVKSGDVLGKIAQEHGVPLQNILDANPGINPDLIKVGQKIAIPSSSSRRKKIKSNVLINGRTAVHAGSKGTLTTVDVCWTKIGKVVVPIPYTNIARSADAAKTASTVFINGNPVCHQKSIFAVSTGDEPGNRKGIRSGTITQKAEFVTGSSNVFIEGIPAARQADLMVSNNANTAPMPLAQPGAPPARNLKPKKAEELEATELPNEVPLTVSGGALHLQNDLVGHSINVSGGSQHGTPATPAAAELSPLAATPPVEEKSDSKCKPDLVIGVFFDGTGNNMMAELADQHTNVAKLYLSYQETSTSRIYVEGVGTKAVGRSDGQFAQDTSVFGLGMGLGPYGGETRLKEARDLVWGALQKYHAEYGPPETVIFDVFGFSRGAMLARHFVNMVRAGLPDLTQSPVSAQSRIFPDLREAETTSAPPSPFAFAPEGQPLYPQLEAEVRVRFLGIFDSVGSFYWPGNDDEGFINGNLAEGSADFVYHPVASDEIRHNFPLTSIAPGLSAGFEETLFGVHSDIGGGYDREPERFFLGQKTYYQQNSPLNHLGINDPIWCDQMQSKAREIGQQSGIVCEVKISANAAQFFEIRRTKPDLSKVALKAMHDKAVTHGVPLRSIDPTDEVPAELVQLIERARTGDAKALKQLDDDYIHTSHRKLAVLALRETIGMDPAEGERRTVFPNRPEQAILP